jgi:hypothetical protein
MPFTEQQMWAWGYLAWRVLPDGSVMAVGPMLFGNGRLYLDVHEAGYGDAYCYDSVDRAIEGMQRFDPAIDEEPGRWKRHPYTGRRRPDGDPAQEHVFR